MAGIQEVEQIQERIGKREEEKVNLTKRRLIASLQEKVESKKQ